MKTLYLLLALFLISITLNAQIIDIPDANFKNALVNTNCIDTDGDYINDSDADTNDDGEISVAEAEAIVNLSISNQNIASLEGIQAFINLESLILESNQLTALDISTLNELYYLILNDNLFTTTDAIIFPTNPTLNDWFILHIENNLLTSVTNLPSNLTGLNCSDNPFSSLDVSGLNLWEFNLSNTPNLTSLVLSSLSAEIRLENVGLTELDITGLTNMYLFNCTNNPNLTYLKIGHGSTVDNGCFYITDNPVLETISFKNGFGNFNGYDYGCYSICNNPNLTFVCADENEIENHTYQVWEGEWVTVVVDGVQQMVDNCGYTNVTVSSYCSFVPGGDYYSIEGNINIDLDDNGCDINDTVLPHVNFEITNGSETGNFISDATGDYSIPVGSGTHIITPVLENPNYFTVTPSSLVVDFPTDTSPYTQDFCVTANGVYKDIDIQIIPLTAATPGFQADYRIIYKNSGNTIIDFGQILLSNDFNLMSEVSFDPSWSSFTFVDETWHFNFEDLLPFETRVIDFSMLINTPMETPAVNGGDVLTFNANYFIEYELVEPETAFVLEQTVVNSFDPNDKTCLEGDFITPEMVGDYVHYMIRFENTGTSSAVNIVVKDDIDRTKYDLSTLVPLNASHEYVARIKDNTSDYFVEFIFENINLPFDDANNDGYIVFKIRTLDTLELNDTFENDAEIYFDFNFPIITNNEQTTVATLSTEDFELANTISLYPNPTTNLLHLDSKQAIKHISIYDIAGRQIQDIAVIGIKTDLTISSEALSAGTYFVKIKTETSEIVKKIIKE